jgi:hypothetical protein
VVMDWEAGGMGRNYCNMGEEGGVRAKWRRERKKIKTNRITIWNEPATPNSKIHKQIECSERQVTK